MYRVKKNKYLADLPKNAEIFEKNGKKYARFKTRKGKRIEAQLTKDGNRILREAEPYSIEYKDCNGIWRGHKGFTNRAATEKLAAKLSHEADQIRNGLLPREHASMQKPLIEHLDDFKEAMLARGTSEKQANQVYNRAYRIIEECGFVYTRDIDGHKVLTALKKFREGSDEKRGISNHTSNGHLQAIKSFCNWLFAENRIYSHPLKHLKGVNSQIDRRHERRALTQKECVKLLTITLKESVRFGMTAKDRVLLYQVALHSGLRASEIISLTVGCCRLVGKTPVLIVEACNSKHREQDIQPIPVALYKKLQQHIKGCDPKGLVFPTAPKVNRFAKMLKADLEAASIKYKDDDGKYADFHALRHTYITNLSKSGVPVKVAMDLARHSSPNLTLAVYSHTQIEERASALKNLPDLDAQLDAETQAESD